MTKTYTAIVIDPIAQTFNYINIDGPLESVRTSLSFTGHVCEEMESYQFSGNDRICVDATAALASRLPSFSITTRYGVGNDVTFYGRAVIVGTTPSGNPARAKSVISSFADRITWGDKSVAFMWKLSDGNNVGGAA